MVLNCVAKRYFKNNFFENGHQDSWKIFLGKEYKNNYSKRTIPVCEYNTL